MLVIKHKLKLFLLKYLPRIFKIYHFRVQAKLTWKNLDELNFEPEILILETFFKSNRKSVFIDIGAHKGEYIYAAEKYLSGDNIHAFEPNPELFLMIRSVFPTCQIHHHAISNINGDAVLKVPLINHHLNDALGSIDTTMNQSADQDGVFFPIKTIRLDSYIKSRHVTEITCIKVDAEGHELQVLEGAKEILLSFKPVLIIEIEKKNYLNYHNVLEIIQHINDKLLAGLAYQVYYYDLSNKKIQLLEEEPNQNLSDWGTRRYMNNFIFIPQGHAFYSALTEINSGIYSVK